MSSIIRRYLPVSFMSVAIVIASAQEKAPMPDLGFSWQDKVFHAAAYSVYAWCIAVAVTSRGRTTRNVMLWMIAGTALFAASDEIHQAYVPGRSCDAADWLADMAGALIASMVVMWRGARMTGITVNAAPEERTKT